MRRPRLGAIFSSLSRAQSIRQFGFLRRSAPWICSVKPAIRFELFLLEIPYPLGYSPVCDRSARNRILFRLVSATSRSARARIIGRLDRVALGNLGDHRSVGQGVFEFRIDYGPGYRLYFIRRGNALVILLCGGDKSTQERDIRKAQALAREWKA